MIIYIKKLIKYLIMGMSEVDLPMTDFSRHKHFRRTLLVVMTAITFIPLIVTVTFSYYQYQALLEKDIRNHLRWNTESASKTITAFIEELQSVVVFISEEYTYKELADQATLSTVFSRLKRRHPGLVDLGFIDPQGVQQTYAGPYSLKEKNYQHSTWFQRTVVRNAHVSDIILGYRKVPHFVIAVNKKAPDQEEAYWVLRADIDATTLERFIATIDTEASDDVFLINRSGFLQTSSRFYGEATEKFPLQKLPFQSGITLVLDDSDHVSKLQAFAYLEGTPWILVLEKRGYNENIWSTFHAQLLGFAFACLVLAMLIILRTANILGNRIRQADEKRELMLSEVEHTSKLASIGRLAAGVAHEINNPLAIISEKTGLMKDLLDLSGEFPHKPNLTGQISGILDAVNRCKVITHRLLGFARRMDVTPELIVINDVIREILSFLDKESLYRGIQFVLALQENLPRIQSDLGQLQQILLNIVNNAIDACEKGGRVTIATRLRDSKNLQITITDNGMGIPPENIKHIFEPFFTTKISGEHKGTGLGLSITYGLVTKLGGHIYVESSVGVGTTFTIEFPIIFSVRQGGSDESDKGSSGR